MEGQREIQTFTYPNMVVRVHFPDLTEEENKRRMKRLHQAAAEILKEQEVKKRETNGKKLL
jgi:ribosome recycling factor